MATIHQSGDEAGISLNIMPLLDIFSILILFLLMNFSTDPVNHDLDQALELPYSATTVSLDELPAVVVSRKDIRVNDKVVAPLSHGELPSGALRQGAIYPLYVELAALAATGKKLESKTVGKADSITIEMDKDHRFSLLKKVMLSAQQADFIKFKMMVAKDI